VFFSENLISRPNIALNHDKLVSYHVKKDEPDCQNRILIAQTKSEANMSTETRKSHETRHKSEPRRQN